MTTGDCLDPVSLEGCFLRMRLSCVNPTALVMMHTGLQPHVCSELKQMFRILDTILVSTEIQPTEKAVVNAAQLLPETHK